MRKQVLVSVDRGETRVAILESKKAAARQGPGRKRARRARRRSTRTGASRELYIERRGRRSIVGNVYKGRVDNVLAGMEAAFVDIGLEKNGFLHVDEIVTPDGKTHRRGRGRGGGPRISDLLKAGQEIVVQVTKDPIGTKGARLTMEVSIPGRYLVYVPDGDGVGVSRRLPDAERERLRKLASGLKLEQRRPDHPHRRARRAQERHGARAAVPVQAPRGAPEPRRGVARADDGVPGGRPAGARRARRLLAGVRARGDRRREAAPPRDELLRAHRAGAGGPRRAVQGRRAAVREVGRRGGVPRRRSRGGSTCRTAAT